MRPTGKLHLGNLHGALRNWIELQNSGIYDCFYFVADWHAITSEYNATEDIKNNITSMMVDWLAAGLDPQKSTLFVQSAVKEHAELFLLLSMITPLAWLERNPTYKEMKAELSGKDLSTFGFLGYPVLQAADIIMYKAYGVPVGVDQLPHVELTREIARRFNFLYKEVFPIPEPLLAGVPKLLGTDGRKMSKSYENSIYISDRGKELQQKISSMFTDPQRVKKTDPGDPGICRRGVQGDRRRFQRQRSGTLCDEDHGIRHLGQTHRLCRRCPRHPGGLGRRRRRRALRDRCGWRGRWGRLFASRNALC